MYKRLVQLSIESVLVFCVVNGCFIYGQENVRRTPTQSPANRPIDANSNNVSKATPLAYKGVVPSEFLEFLPQKYNEKHLKVLCLIFQLKSINSLRPQDKDVIHGDFDGVISENFGLVRPLLKEIFLEGENALPILSRFFDDQTYLYSLRAMASKPAFSDPVTPFTLGFSARELYLSIINPIPEGYFFEHLHDTNLFVKGNVLLTNVPLAEGQTLKDWCKDNEGKSLKSIQEGVVNHLMNQIRSSESLTIEKREFLLKDLRRMKNQLPMLHVPHNLEKVPIPYLSPSYPPSESDHGR